MVDFDVSFIGRANDTKVGRGGARGAASRAPLTARTHTRAQIQEMLKELGTICAAVRLSEAKEVPWFPRRIQDLDSFSRKARGLHARALSRCAIRERRHPQTLDAGADLQSDHPGFSVGAAREVLHVPRGLLTLRCGARAHTHRTSCTASGAT